VTKKLSVCQGNNQMSRCESSAAGLRRLDVTAASLDGNRAAARGGNGRVLGGDVEEARAVEARAVATQEAAPAAPPSTRTRDLCITAGVVVGIFVVVGVIVAIDPFN
jgi:hypothetical protein